MIVSHNNEYYHLERGRDLLYTESGSLDHVVASGSFLAGREMGLVNTKLEKDIPSIIQDITGCRASDLGMADIGECLRGGPNTCSYALPFGYCFLCRHPRLQEIISNTIKAAQVSVSINPN